MHSFYYFFFSFSTSGLFNVAELSNKSRGERGSQDWLLYVNDFFLSQNWNNLDQLREEWDCGEKDIYVDIVAQRGF